MKQVGFFRALWGCCCGTAIFDELRFNSWGRALLHLFLLSVLCAAAITFVQGMRLGPGIRAVADGFFDTFGGVQTGKMSLIPLTDPDRARTFDFSPDGDRIFYFPSSPDGVHIPEKELLLIKFGVIWMPQKMVYLFHEPGSDSWWTVAQGRMGILKFGQYSTEELKHYLAGLKVEGRSGVEGATADVTRAEGLRMLAVMFSLVALLGNFLVVFWVAILYTSLFSLVFRFTGGGRLQTLSFSEFWKIGIYAGFPVMVFAGCFPAFDLPLFQYSTVYMVGLMVYWLLIVGRIERAGFGPEGGKSNE
ncbi:MAG: hypothetical protein HPZ91_10910 [Lentisphaeria bacterium]|nr:hypothetical protein [Lentisphaeria bacterium]